MFDNSRWVSQFFVTAMGSALITGVGAWLAFGANAVTHTELSAAVAAHAQHPHRDAVTNAEFAMLRESIADMRSEIRYIRDLLTRSHQTAQRENVPR